MDTDLIITFGKSHKGQSVEDLIKTEPLYCKWLLSQPFLETNYTLIFNYLTNNLTKDDLLPFGKHKGKTVAYIKESDPKYIEWLKKNNWVKENLANIYDSL